MGKKIGLLTRAAKGLQGPIWGDTVPVSVQSERPHQDRWEQGCGLRTQGQQPISSALDIAEDLTDFGVEDSHDSVAQVLCVFCDFGLRPKSIQGKSPKA